MKYYQQSIPEFVKKAAIALETEILKKAALPGRKRSPKPTKSAKNRKTANVRS